jgi:hypothetical protein
MSHPVAAAVAESVAVTDAELDALAGIAAARPAATATAIDDEEMGPAGDPDPDCDGVFPDEGPPLHWEQVRARVARTRKPPGGRCSM